MTTVGEMCARDAIVTTPETTIAEAAKTMREHHVGSIVVVQADGQGLRRPVGIVTDRDIVVEVVGVDLDPDVITVGDIMVADPVTVRAGESVMEAARAMRSKGVRRLPVVTEHGHLVGVITLDDLLNVITGELAELTVAVEHEQVHEAVSRR